ncbi:MAG TPA: menaquinone biosynthesis protein [Vicinamibacteria bacterium]|nr:menaquinone biosynthesis protein [Vicinamibacteria bacterium]
MTSPLTPSGVPLRLGVVSYLNAAPTVHGLDRDPAFRLIRDVPSRVADLLHAGEVDLGLIPSIEYAAGDYAIVPGVAIGSRGPVRSVNLFHRVPLEAVRRVALDVSSRTSVALARVLLHERLGRDPEYVPSAPSVPAMLAGADAALVIGDHALYFEGPGDRLDLGAEWTARTGLPFVFAFWAGPAGVVTPAGVARLQAALAAGLDALGAIASSYNGLGASRAALNEAYLRGNIVYALGAAEAEGLREFYRRAHALGLVARVPELRFHGHR